MQWILFLAHFIDMSEKVECLAQKSLSRFEFITQAEPHLSAMSPERRTSTVV